MRLAEATASPDAEPSIASIQGIVCEEFGILRRDLLSARRSVGICRPRQIAMWLAVRLTSQSIPAIARSFSRDHTTVLHAVEAVERRIFDCDAWGRSAIALQRRLCDDERQLELGGV